MQRALVYVDRPLYHMRWQCRGDEKAGGRSVYIYAANAHWGRKENSNLRRFGLIKAISHLGNGINNKRQTMPSTWRSAICWDHHHSLTMDGRPRRKHKVGPRNDSKPIYNKLDIFHKTLPHTDIPSQLKLHGTPMHPIFCLLTVQER